MRLIAVVTGTKSMKAREDASLALLNYGFNFFETRVLKKAGSSSRCTASTRRADGQAAVGSPQDLAVTLPRGQADRVEFEVELAPKIFAPLTKSDRVGTLRATIDGKVIAEVPSAADRGRAARQHIPQDLGHDPVLVRLRHAHAPAARLARREAAAPR